MVNMPSVYVVSAAVALVALQMQQTAASSLQYDPYTTCNSYDISDDNFPGRGTEVVDDGNCNVTVPENPSRLDPSTIPTVPVADKSLLASSPVSPDEPLFTKVGTKIQSEEAPSPDSDPDEYIAEQQSTTPSPPAASSTTSRRLEELDYSSIKALEKYFRKPMETKLKNLPTFGVYSSTPWVGSAWPRYRDGINYEWKNGEPSPAEKYAKAFALDVKKFKDNSSAKNGIDSLTYLPQCTSDSECYDPNIATVCAKREGKNSGYCIPTWYGLCHAWAPAAILEKEPKCPVTYNGVTFQPMDIEALVTGVYDDAKITTVFAGPRYNGDNDTIDEYGIHSDYSYRTLNPGFLHIAAANILGLLNSTFIIDRDAGVQVWNHPVVGFKVYEQTAMTPQQAAKTFYGLEKYPRNTDASSIVYVKSRLSWINDTLTDSVDQVAPGLGGNFTTGAYYDYLLELDDAEEIIGGEWLYESNDVHPDFMWIAKRQPPRKTVTSFGLSYANVTMLLKKSVECSDKAA